MSRNLCKTYCHFCLGEVTLVGPTAPISREQAGAYFDEYEGMLVADAECVDCEAKYLAWVDRQTRPPWGFARRENRRFVDLSFRSTFNDEPGEEDLPRYEIKETVIRERVGAWQKPEWW